MDAFTSSFSQPSATQNNQKKKSQESSQKNDAVTLMDDGSAPRKFEGHQAQSESAEITLPGAPNDGPEAVTQEIAVEGAGVKDTGVGPVAGSKAEKPLTAAEKVGNALAQTRRVFGGVAQGTVKAAAGAAALGSEFVAAGVERSRPFMGQTGGIGALTRGTDPVDEARAAEGARDFGRSALEMGAKANAAVEGWTNQWVPAARSGAAQFIAKASDALGEAIPAMTAATLTGGTSASAVLAGTTLSHAIGAANAAGTELIEGSGDINRAAIAGAAEWGAEAIGGKLFDNPGTGKAISSAINKPLNAVKNAISNSPVGKTAAAISDALNTPVISNPVKALDSAVKASPAGQAISTVKKALNTNMITPKIENTPVGAAIVSGIKGAANLTRGAIGEGFEENISGGLQSLITGEKYTAGQAIDDFALGSTVGAMAGGGVNAINAVKGAVNNANSPRAPRKTDGPSPITVQGAETAPSAGKDGKVPGFRDLLNVSAVTREADLSTAPTLEHTSPFTAQNSSQPEDGTPLMADIINAVNKVNAPPKTAVNTSPVRTIAEATGSYVPSLPTEMAPASFGATVAPLVLSGGLALASLAPMSGSASNSAPASISQTAEAPAQTGFDLNTAESSIRNFTDADSQPVGRQQETQVPVERETQTPARQEIQTTAQREQQETQTTAEQETQTPAQQETQTPARQETQTPARQETQTPAEQETQTPAEQETQTPAEQETQTPARQEMQTPAEQETQTLAQQETSMSTQEQTNETVTRTEEITKRKREHDSSLSSPLMGSGATGQVFESLGYNTTFGKGILSS